MNITTKSATRLLQNVPRFTNTGLLQQQLRRPQTATLRILQQQNSQQIHAYLQQLQEIATYLQQNQQIDTLSAVEQERLRENASHLSLNDIEVSVDDSKESSIPNSSTQQQNDIAAQKTLRDNSLNSVERINDERKNNTTFVATSHPTNIEFNFTDANGNPRKPTIYEENNHYHELLAKNSVPENTEIWFGYDMDRHPEESPNVFPYAFLQNMRSSLLRNGLVDENSEIIKECDAISGKLEKAGNEKQVIDVKQELKNLAKYVQLIKGTEAEKFGLKAHYRISSDDLASVEGIEKIRKRLTELKSLQDTFGVMPVSQIIIADCNNSQQIDGMRTLLDEVIPNSGINITPLVEGHVRQEELEDIIAKAEEIVMLAGSDSISRDTYVGAAIMKMKIQRFIHEYNAKNPDNIKTFFEGAGSTINRNGRILPSRMGTILEGMEYMRTIQGQEAQQFIKNYNGHQDITLYDANNSPRCTIKDIDIAEPLFEKIYNDVSKQQIRLQTDPWYTGMFDRQKIFDLVKNNAHYGSRSKIPETQEKTYIKEQRAITQSMIHNAMGFQPEMMYWDTISYDMKNKIKDNINNPLIKDCLNQYALLWQSCDLEESKQWIKDEKLYNNFVQSYKAFQNFMGEIKEMPNCPKDLALHNLDDHSPRFGHTVGVNPQRFNGTGTISRSPSQKSLYSITGAGFSTQHRPTFLEELRTREEEKLLKKLYAKGEKDRAERAF